MAKRAIACVLILSTLISGCFSNSHLHGGKLVAEHKPGETPDTSHTPYKATYVLYHWLEPPAGAPPHTWIPEQQVEELYVRGLERWEPIGFEKDAAGHLVAVAGKEKIPLADGYYCWHISPETEYRGVARVMHEACENTWCVICFPFDVAFAAVLLPCYLATLGFLGFFALGAACAP
jgi:hypothetical protein